MNLTEATTAELVAELAKRDGVEATLLISELSNAIILYGRKGSQTRRRHIIDGKVKIVVVREE